MQGHGVDCARQYHVPPRREQLDRQAAARLRPEEVVYHQPSRDDRLRDTQHEREESSRYRVSGLLEGFRQGVTSCATA